MKGNATTMTYEEYRIEGLRLYDEEKAKALEYFLKAAEGKDIPAGVAIAVYYYEDCEDDDANELAKQWIKKVFGWYKEQKEYDVYVGMAHNVLGQIYYYDEFYNAMAWIEFCHAVKLGDASAYSYLGDMLYAGDWTANGNPYVNGALKKWQKGMELGDERCKELYEEHQCELMNDPVEVSFDNGNSYRGDVNAEGQPHGSGHMDYNLNGYHASYDGQWQNGKRCGKGHYYQCSKGPHPYSYDYNGKWVDDKEHGKGTAVESREMGLHCAKVTETYTGGFREGKRHGHGVVVSDNFDGSFANGQNRFESDFEDGRAVGQAVWDYANGDHFECEVTKNGHGVYTFKSGLRFEGEWKDGQLQTDSIQTDPLFEDPLLVVKEHNQDFGYDSTGTFLLPVTETGYMHYADGMTLSKDSDFNMSGIDILTIAKDSVTLKVKAKFIADDKAQEVTIHRGETLQFKDSRKDTATIYDDDYHYTIEHSLEVKFL